MVYEIDNFYERSESLLASQFQGTTGSGERTNLQKVVFSLISESYSIQAQYQLLVTYRWLLTAQGVQLDGLGEILGLARKSGQPDDNMLIDGVLVRGYRQDLQFQIFINQSSGTPEEIIRIVNYLTQASHTWYFETYPAAYTLITNGLNFPGVPNDLWQAIQNITPAGVELNAIVLTYNTNPFVFSSDPIYEQFFVNPVPSNPSISNPFQVDPGTGLVDFYINKGQTVDPNFGGHFAEGILISYPVYQIDTEGAGQLTEALQEFV